MQGGIYLYLHNTGGSSMDRFFLQKSKKYLDFSWYHSGNLVQGLGIYFSGSGSLDSGIFSVALANDGCR